MSEIYENGSEGNLGEPENIRELGAYSEEIKEVFEGEREELSREELLKQIIEFSKKVEFVPDSPMWPIVSGISRANNCWFDGMYPIYAYEKK